MANDVAQNLKVWLLAIDALNTIVAGRVHENSLPQDNKRDYVWFRQAGVIREDCLDDEPGTPPKSILFDVECCSRILARSIEIAAAIQAMAPCRGAFGDQSIKALFVNDQSEDYEPVQQDIGVHVQSLQIEVMP